MKTSLLCVITGFILLTSQSVFAQQTWEFGISYRYIKFNRIKLNLSESSIHTKMESMEPNELDANFKFNIGDAKLRGTLTLGLARYGNAEITIPNFIYYDCGDDYFNGITQNYWAYRFNPGVEYPISKKRFTYSCGAGIFYYGGFNGRREEVYSMIYHHEDSLGNCLEDSTYLFVTNPKVERRTIATVGVNLNLSAAYQAVSGLSFFVQFSINPMYTMKYNFFGINPNASIGVNWRFKSLGGPNSNWSRDGQRGD